MKLKIFIFCLILFSLFGYLQWGDNNHIFLFQAEIEIIQKLFQDPGSVIHPLTLLPLIGQVLLLILLFQKKPSKLLIFIGMGGIGLLFLLMLFVGLIGLNIKIILSTLPFLIICVLIIRYFRGLKHLDSQMLK
ncbi:hypothetical protein [Hanstruepera marina]|uniref:hypothetical protein n=1 Tax=Hanstruepera marina TaxID=2873265 RepID=UPI001CA65A42|nr:hypothetical protein [Hanstruepera marina]